MASSRKKQDEKNLKTLRELGALPQNKYCFDCNQRGATYVDVTIGSFVCTKCSGTLRGLTPPHRVKSISMATYTVEEIDLLKNRGNDYCRSVWLGLHEGATPPADGRDEQTIRDFMVDKYERKRYYLEPAQALKNGYSMKSSSESTKVKPLNSLVSDPKPIRLNGNNTEFNRKRPEVSKSAGFAVNFDNVDIFASNGNSSSSNNNNNHNNNVTTQMESFANFDDNPVFANSNSNNTMDEFSIFDLNFTNSGPVFNQVPLFPKCNTNRWSMPTPAAFDGFSLTQKNLVNNTSAPPAPAAEDKYAALKDLDNALKSHNVVDWNSSGSNGSLYSSPTPTGSVYSSPSPQGSMFGSPSQGQFVNAFQPNQDNTFSNPFNSSNGFAAWTNGSSNLGGNQSFANPFKEPAKVNGFNHQGFQPAVFPTIATNGATWGVNPFKVGATANANSNNPFL